MFCFLSHEKGTGAKIHPAIVCGIDTGDLPLSYWPIFLLSLVTVPEVFASFFSCFQNGKLHYLYIFLFCITTDTLLHSKDNDKDKSEEEA